MENKTRIAWNKGLTKETDERVKKYGEKAIGKHYHSEAIKKQISKNLLKTYKDNPEIVKQQIKNRIKRFNENPKIMEEAGKKRSITFSENPEILKKMSAIKQEINPEKWVAFSRGKYSQNWNNPFKNSIRKRDNQVCMNCGIHREKLNQALSVHHINYDTTLSIPENCISLCRGCHYLTNSNKEYWIKLFQNKLSKIYSYEYKNEEVVIKI